MQELKNKHEQNIKDSINEVSRLLGLFVSIKRQFFRGFVYGIGAFFGATVGVTIILTLFYWFVPKLDFIPIIGNFTVDIVSFVQDSLENGQN